MLHSPAVSIDQFSNPATPHQDIHAAKSLLGAMDCAHKAAFTTVDLCRTVPYWLSEFKVERFLESHM